MDYRLQKKKDFIISYNSLFQVQGSFGGKHSYSTGSSGIMSRPASVAAGYSDLMLPLGGSANSGLITTGGQLSRELDRLHREQEVMRGQLAAAERSTQQSKQEAEAAKLEAAELRETLQQQQKSLQQMEETVHKSNEETVRIYFKLKCSFVCAFP